MSSKLKARRWVFTTYDIDCKIDFDESYCHYYILQQETCPTTQKQHLQGYVEYKIQKTFNQTKKFLSDGKAHWEVAHGNPEQCRDYCRKQDTRTENGRIEEGGKFRTTRQGARSDLEMVKEAIEKGKTEVEIADTHFESWVRNNRAFEKYRQLIQEDRMWETEVYWIWGDAGSGKSRVVWDQYPKEKVWNNADFQWFDFYNGQEIVLIDDISPDCKYNLTMFLNLTDRYPLRVPIKGGFVKWVPKKIYITSNYRIQEVYNGIPAKSMEAILRRITEIINL